MELKCDSPEPEDRRSDDPTNALNAYPFEPHRDQSRPPAGSEGFSRRSLDNSAGYDSNIHDLDPGEYSEGKWLKGNIVEARPEDDFERNIIVDNFWSDRSQLPPIGQPPLRFGMTEPTYASSTEESVGMRVPVGLHGSKQHDEDWRDVCKAIQVGLYTDQSHTENSTGGDSQYWSHLKVRRRRRASTEEASAVCAHRPALVVFDDTEHGDEDTEEEEEEEEMSEYTATMEMAEYSCEDRYGSNMKELQRAISSTRTIPTPDKEDVKVFRSDGDLHRNVAWSPFESPSPGSQKVARTIGLSLSSSSKVGYTPIDPQTPGNCVEEGERHSIAAMKIRTIPMRLATLNLFVAFVFLALMHLELRRVIGERRHEAAFLAPQPDSRQTPVCQTVHCTAAGTHIFYTLNQSAQPCESIYDYVCRPWVHATPAKYSRIVLGARKLFVDTIFAEIQRGLESTTTTTTLSTERSSDKLRLLYRQCVSMEERKRAGLVPFQKLMRRYLLDGWPFGRTYAGILQKSLARFVHDTGTAVFFKVSTAPEAAEVLTVECPPLELPSLSYTEMTEDFERYRAFIAGVIREVSASNPSVVATEIASFEADLARLSTDHCHQNEGYTTRSTKDQEVAAFNWTEFAADVVENTGRLRISGVRSRAWSYIGNATEMIASNSVPAANYLGWRVARRLLPHTVDRMAELLAQFRAAIGRDTFPLSRQCIFEIAEVMPLAMGRLYTSLSPRASTNFDAFRIVYTFLAALDHFVFGDRWFHGELLNVYRLLRATMRITVGFPLWLANDTIIDSVYSAVRISNAYVDTYISAATATFQNSFDPASIVYGEERHVFPADASPWGSDFPSIYDIRDNRFGIFPEVLQPHYYDDGGASSLNFGGFGFLIARDFLREALSQRSDVFWCRAIARADIFARHKCLESRLSQRAPGVPLDGLATIVLAAKLAFVAYQDYGDFEDDATLRGLQRVTPEQLFFVALARTLCTMAREEHYVEVVSLSREAAALSLVDAALGQMAEFRDAFNCTKSGNGAYEGCFKMWRASRRRSRRQY